MGNAEAVAPKKDSNARHARVEWLGERVLSEIRGAGASSLIADARSDARSAMGSPGVVAGKAPAPVKDKLAQNALASLG